jgi:predicted Zn-dependent protease
MVRFLGDRAVPGAATSAVTARSLRERLLGQLVSTTAKMLGVSHLPCSRERCVLRFPNDVEELDAKGTEFCEEHAAEVAAFLKARQSE